MSLQVFSQTIGADGVISQGVQGRHFRIMDDGGGAVRVELQRGGQTVSTAAGVGSGFWANDVFDGYSVFGAAGQSVQWVVSDGQSGFDVAYATVAVGNAAGAVTSTAATVTNASGLLVAANAARRLLAVQNKSASGTVWIAHGAAATTSNGWRLLPGESVKLDAYCSTAAVHAIGDALSNADVVVVEG